MGKNQNAQILEKFQASDLLGASSMPMGILDQKDLGQ
jgi:hypothetical protein